MTRISNLNLFMAMMVMLIMMLVFATIVLGPALSTGGTVTIAKQQQQKKSSPPKQWIKNWARGQQTSVRPDLELTEHARTSHVDERYNAVETYKWLLEGKCVASVTFCGTEFQYLHLCVAPGTEKTAAIMQRRNTIYGGYAGDEEYWDRKILPTPSPPGEKKGGWDICADEDLWGWMEVFND